MRKIIESFVNEVAYYDGFTVKDLIRKGGKNEVMLGFLKNLPDNKGKTSLQITGEDDMYEVYRKDDMIIVSYTDDEGNTEIERKVSADKEENIIKLAVFLERILTSLDDMHVAYSDVHKDYIVKNK